MMIYATFFFFFCFIILSHLNDTHPAISGDDLVLACIEVTNFMVSHRIQSWTHLVARNGTALSLVHGPERPRALYFYNKLKLHGEKRFSIFLNKRSDLSSILYVPNPFMI